MKNKQDKQDKYIGIILKVMMILCLIGLMASMTNLFLKLKEKENRIKIIELETENKRLSEDNIWYMEKIDALTEEVPNINNQNNIVLDELSKLDGVYHWEIVNDTLRILTIKEELQNEIERLKYIREQFYE